MACMQCWFYRKEIQAHHVCGLELRGCMGGSIFKQEWRNVYFQDVSYLSAVVNTIFSTRTLKHLLLFEYLVRYSDLDLFPHFEWLTKHWIFTLFHSCFLAGIRNSISFIAWISNWGFPCPASLNIQPSTGTLSLVNDRPTTGTLSGLSKNRLWHFT